ncbi:MAG: DNA primase [Endomicrobium sp.]|jgi:DNA primase|nr:DNA primase [Endomicrobium sp.]
MTISEDVIERVRSSNDIGSVIREYLPNLKRVGRNWKVCCPFHDEKIPSFVVSSEKGIFRCFGCNVVGDVFKFVMLSDKVSWIEAIKKLAKRANIEIQETKQDVIKKSEKEKLFEILEMVALFYHKCLLETADGRKARDYLEKRGVRYETLRKFKIGFAPKEQLFRFASKKGYSEEHLLKTGLITKTEKGFLFEYMSERVVFPIFDIQGRIIAFGGRTIINQTPKYLNTPETIVYSKSSNLYGLFQTLPDLRKGKKLIILEGYMDVVIPCQFGISGAVATLGTAFTYNHAKLIARYSDMVTLLFDSDEAGRMATQRSLEILIENNIEVRVSSLPENVDADEYLNKKGRENFLKLLNDSSKSAIDFMIARVCGKLFSNDKKVSSEMKAKAVSNLLDFVCRTSNFIIQRDWIKNIAQCLELDEESIWLEFKNKLKLQKCYANNLKISANDVVVNKKRSILSLEEILLNLIIYNKNYVNNVSEDSFSDMRCKNIFNLLRSGLSNGAILNKLSEEDGIWFSKLTLNAIEYSNVEEALRTILKDIEFDMLRKKSQELKKEIILMSEGKKKEDIRIFEEYKKLMVFIKGSEK